MSQKLKISAETRTDLGKGASRRLRRLANKVPAILYGGEEQPASLTLVYRELDAIMKDEAFYSQVMALNISGKNQDVVVRDLQRHPATDRVTHVDFFRVDADKALQVSVPLHFLNEETCIGVKQDGGIISHLMNELEISCLPADLPAYIEVDLIDPATMTLPLPGIESTSTDSAHLQSIVKDATAVVIATPEYHGSFSSVTKLVIENLGFPSVLATKPVALVGVAAGTIGAIKSLEALRGVCSHVGAIVLPGPVSVAGVRSVFDANGDITDERVEKQLRGVAVGLLHYIDQNVCPRFALEAMVREQAA